MWMISIFVILLTVFVCAEAQVRIVGGKPAKPGSFPYQVGLNFVKDPYTSDVFWCGGALISNQYVLTAAHCMVSKIKNSLEFYNSVYVYLGMTEQNSVDEEGQQILYVSKEYFTIHFNYNHSTKHNDIALIELPEPIEFTKYIQIAHLSSRYQTEKDLLNKNIISSGWGRTHENNGNSDILMYIRTNIISGDVCHKLFKNFYKNEHFCVYTAGKSLCDGDSGGPNIIKENDVNIIIGITSFGSHFCSKSYPQILTKVSHYIDWISNITGIISI